MMLTPAAPRVLVFVQNSERSIRTTGWLEKHSVGTLRCWTVADVGRVLKEAGGILGAAVVDLRSDEADGARATISAQSPTLPVILIKEAEQDTYSFAEPTTDAFARRVLEVLAARP